MRLTMLPSCLLLAAIVAPACGEGSDSASEIEIIDSSIASSGDRLTSASIGVGDDGNLLVTLAPILDPTGMPYGIDGGDKITVSTTLVSSSSDAGRVTPLALAEGSACATEIAFGAGTDSSADVAFLVDTTASMGTAVTGISNSIEEFAQELSDAGLDVQFSFVTVGDSFNTKSREESIYTTGIGQHEPTDVDRVERPLLEFHYAR